MFHNHIGINLAENKIQFVEITYKQKLFFLENLDQVFIKENLSSSITKGFNFDIESKFIDILQEAFNKITSKKKPVSKFVSFSLPDNFFFCFEVPFEPTLTRNDLIEHFNWELKILFPFLQDEEFLIQHIEVNKSSVRKEDKAIIFALNKSIITLLKKFCAKNGLELKYVDNVHLSSLAFLHLSKLISKETITYCFYIDQNFSSFAAIEGINPFYFNIFETNNLLEFIDKTLLKLSSYKIHSAEQILICGQNITDEVIIKLEDKFNQKIIKINPFERLKVEDHIKKNPYYVSQFNSFTAATGMAIRVI